MQAPRADPVSFRGEELRWLQSLLRRAVKATVKEYSSTSTHLFIYEDVINNFLPQLIQENPIMMWNEHSKKKHVFQFDQLHFGVPSIVEPTTGLLRTVDTATCRNRHADYSCPVYARITYRIGHSEGYPRQKTALLNTREVAQWTNAPLFWMPVMVGSSLCRETDINALDVNRGGSSGCFIIEGKAFSNQDVDALRHADGEDGRGRQQRGGGACSAAVPRVACQPGQDHQHPLIGSCPLLTCR